MRKVKTASGATAVQIAERRGGRDHVLEHLGSAHTDVELTALLQVGRKRLHPGQDMLDVEFERGSQSAPATVQATSSRLLVEAIQRAWGELGFTAIFDEAFFQLVLARVVEPTSVRDAGRVLSELGLQARHRNTFIHALKRCQGKAYRDHLATACFEYAATAGDVSLVLYDVTTLYFEAEHEDELRKVGFSKGRRVDPQIVVGLLVDRNGFPLEVGCYEGNKAETATIIPIVKQFQARHGLSDMVVVAEAGMLSTSNLSALDEAGLRFIVGSRAVKAPGDLASHFRWHGDAFADGQVIDTITPKRATAAARAENDTSKRAEPVWDPAEHPGSWRAVWAYSNKRAVRDRRTLTLQENRAKAVIAGEKASRAPRFVKTTGGNRVLDATSLERAYRLVGLKGYVSNIPIEMMPAREVIADYHALWQVEASFRMSKTDLRARPIFSHSREAIEAHLTIVFAALAISRYLQQRTGSSIRHIVRTLRPLQHVTINIAGQPVIAEPQIPAEAQRLLDALTH